MNTDRQVMRMLAQGRSRARQEGNPTSAPPKVLLTVEVEFDDGK